ncbi:MAG: immune inhibitor A, partial [Myxococcota bacterium]|nr:immune inhibitor A [Myxococcota bacterium]
MRIWVVVGLAGTSLALTGCGDDDRPEIDAGELDAGRDASDGTDADMPELDADMPELDADMPELDAGEELDGGGEDLDGGPETDAGMDTDAGVMVMPSCSDGRRNGDETGVDCGGPTCPTRCPDLGRCSISSDCASRVCIGGTCIAPACTDGVRNGDETGSDCGGPTCSGCGLGQGCASEDDCAAGTCSGGFCVADHCFDMTRNVNETDVDCGGADCAPCNAGEQCRTNRDCNMSTCEGGFCLTPECSNGMPDMGEVDVDCGGECPGCDDGTACTMGVDCLSGRCETGICTSCNDGAQNGMETGVDCGGGVCRGCPAGQMCMGNEDCASRVCTAGVCEGAATYYREDFEGDDGGWTTGGTTSSWAWGTPAATLINAAAEGLSAWVTNLTGDYVNFEDSWVQSPSFSLAGSTNPALLSFQVAFETESCCDYGWVEVSTNGGTSWTRLTGARTGGYTNTTSNYWSGTRSAWTRVEFVLPASTVGAADVRLRFRLDADVSSTGEGFGIDDIAVVEDICGNGVADPAETDVDCGGDICGPCDDGLDCTIDEDCDSEICDLGTCVSCDDEIENGGETDLDCGGADCGPCNDTQTCSVGTDCLSGRCEAGVCTSCFDGIQNGGETFIDCGAGGCGLCLGGAGCTDGAQCVSGTCDAGVCTTPPATTLEWNFDTDGEGWTVGGSAASWEYGTPSTTDLNSAYTGTGVWITNADGNYNANEQSWVQSPSFSLAGVSRDPELQLAIAYVLEGTTIAWEAVWVEVSTDGGTMWRTVSNTIGGGTNWY